MKLSIATVLGLLFAASLHSQVNPQIAQLSKRVADLEAQVQSLQNAVRQQHGSSLSATSLTLTNPADGSQLVVFIDKDGYLRIARTDGKAFAVGPSSLAFYDGDKMVEFMSFGEKVLNSQVPSKAEWELLKWTANHAGQLYLSEKLIQNHLATYYSFPFSITLFVDTDTQPSWHYYSGNGRFSVSDREVRVAYSEAATELLSQMTKTLFDVIGLDSKYSQVKIYFSIRGSSVGVFADGTFKLEGE